MQLKKLFHTLSCKTPIILQFLLVILLFSSLGYLLCEAFFSEFTQKILEPFLGLSWNGVLKGKVWQFFTFFLTQPSSEGFSFNFFFVLFAKLYLVWFTGLSIIEVKGNLHFFFLYLCSALLGALFVLPTLMWVNPQFFYMNILGPIYSLAIAWIMLHPNSRIFLFSRIPFRANSLLGWIFITNLFLDLFDGKYIDIAFYLGCAIFGYLFALLAWGCKSPIKKLQNLENFLLENTTFLRRLRKRKCEIYDFRTKKPKN